MKKYKWEWRFHSEPVIVRQIVCEILTYIDEALPGMPREERCDIRLIFSELLFNAVIHGNAMNSGKCVHLSLEVFGDNLSATVSDEGTGYDYRAAIEHLYGSEDDLQKESGRGMKLVLALADAVSFNDSGSQVMFVKKVKRVVTRG